MKGNLRYIMLYLSLIPFRLVCKALGTTVIITNGKINDSES